jgi:hypothetical protein
MLNRLKSDTVIIDDACAQARLTNIVGNGRNGLEAFRHINAAKQDAGVGGGRMDGDANEPTGVQTYAIKGNNVGDRRLHGRLRVALHGH